MVSRHRPGWACIMRRLPPVTASLGRNNEFLGTIGHRSGGSSTLFGPVLHRVTHRIDEGPQDTIPFHASIIHKRTRPVNPRLGRVCGRGGAGFEPRGLVMGVGGTPEPQRRLVRSIGVLMAVVTGYLAIFVLLWRMLDWTTDLPWHCLQGAVDANQRDEYFAGLPPPPPLPHLPAMSWSTSSLPVSRLVSEAELLGGGGLAWERDGDASSGPVMQAGKAFCKGDEARIKVRIVAWRQRMLWCCSREGARCLGEGFAGPLPRQTVPRVMALLSRGPFESEYRALLWMSDPCRPVFWLELSDEVPPKGRRLPRIMGGNLPVVDAGDGMVFGV